MNDPYDFLTDDDFLNNDDHMLHLAAYTSMAQQRNSQIQDLMNRAITAGQAAGLKSVSPATVPILQDPSIMEPNMPTPPPDTSQADIDRVLGQFRSEQQAAPVYPQYKPPQVGAAQGILTGLAALLDPLHSAANVGASLSGVSQANDRAYAREMQQYAAAQQEHRARIQSYAQELARLDAAHYRDRSLAQQASHWVDQRKDTQDFRSSELSLKRDELKRKSIGDLEIDYQSTTDPELAWQFAREINDMLGFPRYTYEAVQRDVLMRQISSITRKQAPLQQEPEQFEPVHPQVTLPPLVGPIPAEPPPPKKKPRKRL